MGRRHLTPQEIKEQCKRIARESRMAYHSPWTAMGIVCGGDGGQNIFTVKEGKMLSEQETVDKLEEYAKEFGKCVRDREYGKAHNIYQKAHEVAVFMEMGADVLKKLFGDWESDDGTETDTALDNGLFQRRLVARVDLESCIIRHKAYEDMACRVVGEPEGQYKYYSDQDYCARCREKKKAGHWE